MVTKESAPVGVGEGLAFTGEDPVGWYLDKVRAIQLRDTYTPRDVKDVRPLASDLFRKQLGQRCKQARGDMEVAEAAKILGVHRNTLWSLERGDTLPDAFDLEIMARAYKTTADHLLTGHAPVTPSPHKHESRLLSEVVAAVLKALEDQGLKLPNQKVAQLVDLIYEHEVAQLGASNEPGVQRTTEKFLRLVAA